MTIPKLQRQAAEASAYAAGRKRELNILDEDKLDKRYEREQVWYEHFLFRCRITNVQLAVKSMVKIIMSKGHYLRENCEITKFEDQLGMHFKNIKMPS